MQFSPGKILFGASIIAIASSAFIAPVYAQDEGNVAVEASEIVVTARRKDERLQDVPLTVNAVAAEDLSKLSIRRFEDVTAAMPGLAMAPNPNGISVTASVRGVNYEGNASGNNGTIEFYRNDTPISGSALFQAMYDVGQIELLRGPQGTLRGRASPSGSMTVTTHRVNLSEIGGYVSAAATDLGGINANGALNIPVIKDVLAVRLATIIDENEGSRVRSINNGMKPYSRTTGGRLTVRFEPTSNLSLDYSYEKTLLKSAQFQQVESDSTVIGTLTAAPQRTILASERLSVANAPYLVRQKFDIHNWQAAWAFAGQKLVYVGSAVRQNYDNFEPNDKGDVFSGANYDGLAVDLNAYAAAPSGSYPGGWAATRGVPAIGGFTFRGDGQVASTRARQLSHEVRLQSEVPLFGALDYVVGGFLASLNSPTDRVIGGLSCTAVTAAGVCTPATVSAGLAAAGVPNGYSVSLSARRGQTREKSIFGNMTLHIGDATEVSGGARYIRFEDSNLPRGYNAVIYSGSIKHRFSEDLMVYASTGSSWRPGINVAGQGNYLVSQMNLPTLASCNCNEYAFRVLSPEKSKSYELGFKSSFFNRKLRLNVTAFHQNFTNYVYRAPGLGVSWFKITNYGTGAGGVVSGTAGNFIAGVPVKVNGLEAEIMAQPTRNWSIGTNVSYSMAKIKDGVIPCNPTDPRADSATLDASHTVAACRVNQRAGFTAPLSANLQSEYFRSVSANVDGYIRGLVNFTGQSQGNPSYAGDNTKAYAIANLYVGIRDPKGAWDVNVYAKNLTNLNMVLSRESSVYSDAITLAGASATYNSWYRGVSVTRPREFGVNLRYAFGSR